jgi:hypothetical protein
MRTIKEVEEARALRKAKLAEDREVQRVVDLEALDAAELEHGDSRVASVNVPFVPGRVTMAIVKCPAEPVIKRYRSQVRPDKDGRVGDTAAAAEALADLCIVYPPKDALAQLFADRPGLHAQLGLEAMRLSVGEAEAEGKG